MDTKIHPNAADDGRQAAPDRLLTTQEVADLLSLSTESVYRHLRAGRLNGVRLGRTIRFVPAEITRILHQSAGGLW